MLRGLLINLILCTSLFAQSDIEQALADLKSPEMQVRRDAIDGIAYSDDPRIPYACLPLLNDKEGSTTRNLALRAIGSRFQFVKRQDVPQFVAAIEPFCDEHRPWNIFSDRLLCERAIGLLTREYSRFPKTFSISPDGKWAIYERCSVPIIVDIQRDLHVMMDSPFRSHMGRFDSESCKWRSDSKAVCVRFAADRRNSALCIYDISSRETWAFKGEDVCETLNLFPRRYSSSAEVSFDHWQGAYPVIQLQAGESSGSPEQEVDETAKVIGDLKDGTWKVLSQSQKARF